MVVEGLIKKIYQKCLFGEMGAIFITTTEIKLFFMTYQCNILQRYDIYDNFKFFFAFRHFHRKVPMQFISCDRTSYNLQTQTQSSYLTRNKSDFNNISYLLHILRCNQNMSH